MKFFKLCSLVLAFVFVIAGASLAADYVDVGNTASETNHNLASWGPPEPATSGGSWGGIGSWSPPGTCRVIWALNDHGVPSPGSIDSFIDLTFGSGQELVSFRHLDGPADDSFEVWIGTSMVFSYTDSGQPGERWYVSGFFHTAANPGVVTLRFEAIGQAWPSWGTYGQVAIAGVWVGPGGPVAAQKSSWGGVKALFR